MDGRDMVKIDCVEEGRLPFVFGSLLTSIFYSFHATRSRPPNSVVVEQEDRGTPVSSGLSPLPSGFMIHTILPTLEDYYDVYCREN